MQGRAARGERKWKIATDKSSPPEKNLKSICLVKQYKKLDTRTFGH